MDINKLQKLVIEFRDRRNWLQFHRPKEVAMDISIEAAEILEHFLWMTDAEIKKYLSKSKNRKAVGEEVCDVIHACLILAHELNIDIPKMFLAKMHKNARKYPIRKSKGSNKKYNLI